MQEQREHFKYKVTAHIVSLQLNKNINFQTKITWKRNVNKAQTEPATHQNCTSIFDQTLELELNLVYNHQQSKFETKLTEFSVVVIYQGKIKSGGHVRYDAAQIINDNFSNEHTKLSLTQCPDPNAYIEVIFNYEVLGESSRSLFNELSMLDPSGIEKDLSQIDFREEENQQSVEEQRMINTEKQNMEDLPLREKEIQKINNILDKFESVTRRIVTSPKSTYQEDQNTTRNSNLELSSIPTEQEEKLRTRVTELQNQIEIKNAIIEDYQKKLEDAHRNIQELELKLELSTQKIIELEDKQQSYRIDRATVESQSKYQQLYQTAVEELQELRSSTDHNLSKQNRNLNKLMEDVHKIDEIPQFQTDRSPRNNSKTDQLQRQNIELQTKVASISHNIAQLFNAAYDYGGAKLLDYLQNSIGLIQS